MLDKWWLRPSDECEEPDYEFLSQRRWMREQEELNKSVDAARGMYDVP